MSRWPALAAGLLVLAVLGPVQARALDPAEVPEANATSAAPDRPLAFGDCVGLALARSPFFKNSEIEIEVRGLDETDSRYKLLPKIKFRTQVYLNTPNNTSYSRHYTLEFATDNYNPVEAYFDFKARKIITKIASLSHLNNISDGLARLAERFLDLDALAKAEALDRELLDLARENTQYVNSRIGNGASAPLDTRIAVQREELAALELEKTGQAATALRQDLKAFMGLDAALEARFDLRDARRQVLAGFDPLAAGPESALANSLDLKIQDLKAEVQELNIDLAKARYVPELKAGTRTTDPLSNDVDGLYWYLGLETTIWDWNERWRDVQRQRKILDQARNGSKALEAELAVNWRRARVDMDSAVSEMKLALAEEVLAELNARKTEIRYRAGTEDFSEHLEARRSLVRARLKGLEKTLAYEKAVLGLRHLSGDLLNSYVQANIEEKSN